MFRTFMNGQRLFREETFITIFALKSSVAMNFHMMPQSRTVSKISSAKVTHMVLRKVLKVVDCMSPVKSKVESNFLTPTCAALIAHLISNFGTKFLQIEHFCISIVLISEFFISLSKSMLNFSNNLKLRKYSSSNPDYFIRFQLH